MEIVSFEARDPDAGDAIFSTGDEIGIGFNIPTNQADLPNEMISRVQLESVFTFTMSMGLDFIGRWVSPTSLRITILNATVDRSRSLSHPPYVGFSGLSVSVKESGELVSLQDLSELFLASFVLPESQIGVFHHAASILHIQQQKCASLT